MERVTIALIGSGYGAELHMNAYSKVHGVKATIKTIVDLDLEKAKAFSKKYNIENYTDNLEEVLQDETINVIDIATPPASHLSIAKKAFKAKKHVICEKPLTGYFGEANDKEPIGTTVVKSKMYNHVINEIIKFKKLVKLSNKKFMYAENFVYCPSVLKAEEILKAKKSKLLYLKGEESIKGSSSPVAGQWSKTGGGSLIRIGTHPLSAILHLKSVESIYRKENIFVKSVTADMGTINKNLTQDEKIHLTSNPRDVEDFSNITLTFSDNTKAIIIANDNTLGGSKNYIEIYANDGVLKCNITPANNLESYFLDQEHLEDIYFSEMLEHKTGWNDIFLIDEYLRGYVYEMQDFIESIINGREPRAGIDLAFETTKIIYAAYKSADEGRTVYL